MKTYNVVLETAAGVAVGFIVDGVTMDAAVEKAREVSGIASGNSGAQRRDENHEPDYLFKLYGIEPTFVLS